jgi:hypothetical protein
MEDGRVLVLVRGHGRGRTSGVAVDDRRANIFEVRGRKVVKLTIYAGRDRASPTSAWRMARRRRLRPLRRSCWRGIRCRRPQLRRITAFAPVEVERLLADDFAGHVMCPIRAQRRSE